jgi:hypothetical protein
MSHGTQASIVLDPAVIVRKPRAQIETEKRADGRRRSDHDIVEHHGRRRNHDEAVDAGIGEEAVADIVLWDLGTKQATKRFCVEGNSLRFVRPGFMRVGTTGTAPAGVLLSAYKKPVDGTVATGAINNNTSATELSLFISGAAPWGLTPWVTSASDTLASKASATVSRGWRPAFMTRAHPLQQLADT